ncbi:hypothetical protein I6A84_36220, partial [Frankia sp. CNm7]
GGAAAGAVLADAGPGEPGGTVTLAATPPGAATASGATTMPTATATPTAPATTAPRTTQPGTAPPSALATTVVPSATMTVGPGMLLTAADLGPGGWADVAAEPFEGGGDAWFWADACAGYQRSDYPSRQRQLDWAVVGYATDGGARSVLEEVEAFALGFGARSLADVRAVVAFCENRPAFNAERTGAGPTTNTIIRTGFAGDESLLVRQSHFYYDGATLAPEPRVTLTAVVRVGDRVATVWCDGLDTEQVLVLARRAATRL